MAVAINQFMTVFQFQTVDQYILVVKGQDLNGESGGNTATSTVTINIGDVNDNPPILEKEQVHFFLTFFYIMLMVSTC